MHSAQELMLQCPCGGHGGAHPLLVLAVFAGAWLIFTWIKRLVKSKGAAGMSKYAKVVTVLVLIAGIGAVIAMKNRHSEAPGKPESQDSQANVSSEPEMQAAPAEVSSEPEPQASPAHVSSEPEAQTSAARTSSEPGLLAAPANVSSDAVPLANPVEGLPKLVDLGAHACIPCKMMAPILEELTTEFKDRFDVLFIDVWQNPDEGTKYRINSIPTQIFFDGEGKELFRHEGFFSREDILKTWTRLGFAFAEEK